MAIDIVNVADGPRASSRMSNMAFCAQAAALTGVEPILHVCCRDRNYLGLIAHLLGAHALGIRNLVVITGDPPKMGDYPFATPVYDVDSIGLLEIASALNAGVDPTGKELAGRDVVRPRHRRRARRGRSRPRAANASQRRRRPAPSW